MSNPSDGDARAASWWEQHRGFGAIVGTAIHSGHAVREELLPHYGIGEADRLREEDPFTEFVIQDIPNRIVFHRSRFEADVNRARAGAIYRTPEQSWGLKVWKGAPPEKMFERSLAVHDSFYRMVEAMLHGIADEHGAFVVLDVHSYNHRRDGPDADPTHPEKAPEVNIGTASMPRDRWAHVVDPFMQALRDFDYRGRRLDVRENVSFQGKGEFARFVHATFPGQGCDIAIEFKKFFMDEWTGEPSHEDLDAMRALINSTVPVIEAALRSGR